MKCLAIFISLAMLFQATHGSLFEFSRMINQATGRSALQFLSYGCYCGRGGQGSPVDSIDWCCHAHDCCYGSTSKQACLPYINPYKYDVNCEDIICYDDEKHNKCARIVCECDRAAALCFKRYNSTYSSSKINYRLQGKCKQQNAPCDC